MARNPNDLKFPESPKDDPADLRKLPKPAGIPDAALYGGDYYAIVKVYQNGRRVVEWYKRNTGTPGAPTPDDPLQTTSEDVLPSVREEWDAGDQKEDDATKPPGGIPSKPINGQVFQWNPQTRAYDIPTDQAPAPRQAPGGAAWKDDGADVGSTGRRWGWNQDTGLYDRDLGPSPAAQGIGQTAKPAGPKGELREIGGHLREFDPTTGDFTIDHGATTSSSNGTAVAEQPVKDRPGWREVTTKTTKDGNSAQGTYYLGPDGTRYDTLPGQETSASETKALEGFPGWRVTTRGKKDANGNTVAETVYIDPQGHEQPTPPAKPENKYVQIITGKNDGRLYGLTREGNLEPIKGDPNAVETPNGMPAFTPDIGKPGFGVIEYAQQLAALKSQGALTDAQVAQFVTTAHQQVTSEAGRLDALIGVQRQLQNNEVSQRNVDVNASTQRLGLANQATATALSTSMEIAGNFTPASYARMGKPILPAILAMQNARAQDWGGMNMPGRVDNSQYPALNAVGGMGLNSPAPTAQPSVQQQAPVQAQSNTIGAGAVPSVVQPAQPNNGITNATDAGGVPRAYSPAQSTVGPAVQQVAPPPMAQPEPPPIGMQQPQQAQPTVLPAAIQMGIVTELAQSGRYPTEILREAASRLGWG